MSPFRNSLRLSTGDFLAKSLNFLAFIYLARRLGVENFGVLEFGASILAYFFLLADGGLEIWATREVAKRREADQLLPSVVSLRLLLASLAFGTLLLLFPALPTYEGLRTILLLLGFTLFVQALNLKWVFLGLEKMGNTATGLVVGQLVFSLAVFGLIRRPEQVVLVPLIWLTGDGVSAGYYLWQAIRELPGIRFKFSLAGARRALKPALTMGATQGLGVVSYNFDTVLLGFMAGASPVGWYRAAYKLITAALAVPLTFFLGLFPALSRTYAQDRLDFEDIAGRTLQLATIFALPLGVGGTFLAAPIIELFYGLDYARSVPVMQLLSWSAVLVILRGTFRQGLNAAGKQQLDLRSAVTAVALNVALNLILIPRLGLQGAALATVVSDLVWLGVAAYYFSRYVAAIRLVPRLLQLIPAVAAMGACLYLLQSISMPLRATVALAVYFGLLYLLGQSEVRDLLGAIRV